MHRETLLLIALQSGALFVALWGIFRLAPSIPANAKAWMWRLAFLKPLLSLLPFATVSLPILKPAPAPVVELNAVYADSEPVFYAPPAPSKPAVDPLLAAWLLGVAGVSLHAFVGMRRALRVVSGAEPVQSAEINKSYKDLLDKSGVRRRPALLQSKNVTSAMLIGGRRYAIILPTHVINSEFEDVRLMLAHEVAHIARHDLFWFGLASASQSLFFFNPMVWVAARCSRLDHESATDLHASRLAGVPIQRYADMLLRATVVARPSYAPGSLPVAESYRSIHRRLEAMKHFNSKPTLLRRTATAALAMLTLSLIPAYEVVAAGAPKMQDPPQPAQIKEPKKTQAQPTKTAATKWYVVSGEGTLTQTAAPKQTRYKVYEMKNGKWVEVKGSVKVWRVETTKGKKGKKGKTYKVSYEFLAPGAPGAPRIAAPAKAPGAPAAPGAPGAPKIASPARGRAPGQPPLLVTPTIVTPGRPGVPAGAAPGAPTTLPPKGQGVPSPGGAPAGIPPVAAPGGGVPAGIPQPTQVTTAKGFLTTVNGQVATVKGGRTVLSTINAQGQVTTQRVGLSQLTTPLQGQKVQGYRLVPLQNTQSAKGLTYRVISAQGVAVPTTSYRVVPVQGGSYQVATTVQGGKYVTKPVLISQGKLASPQIYRGTVTTPLIVDGKKLRVYTGSKLILGKKRKKGGAQEKPAPNNHHGATDPTFTGYSGV